MYKKEMTYTDYNGNVRTENFYFNLTKAEVIEMELEVAGGLEAYINKIVAEQDLPRLIKIFKDLLLRSYGEKSLDGKRFIKSDELRTAFSQTEAYSDLYTLLATDSEAAAEFVNGITPTMPEDHKKAAANIAPVPAVQDASLISDGAKQ